MRIEDALERFLVQLEANGRSEHTRRHYRRSLLLLAGWAQQEGLSGEIEEIGHEHLAAFLASPQARCRADGGPREVSTVNALRGALKTFFGFAAEAGYSASNPARLIRRARCSPPPPRALSEKEQEMLLATLTQAEKAGGGPAVERDHMLFRLLLATGVRIGSALAVEGRDVDLARGELLLRRAKGGSADVVFLSRAVRKSLRTYLKARADGALFTGRDGHPISVRHAHRRLNMWLHRAGIARPASPHTLRHTFACSLLARTQDIALVQAALGHRSVASTAIYARVDRGRLRAAVGA